MDKIVNPVIGEEVTFLKTSRQTTGEESLLEVVLGPKGGNPLHYHHSFSETFQVLEGELNVQIGKDKLYLKPGDIATAPARTIHRFYNTSGKQVRFICKLTPACEGFENVLRIGFGLAKDGYAGSNGMPKNIWHNAVLMNMGDGCFVGIFSLFEKFFKFLGKKEKARKIEKELLEKYCS